MDPATHSFYLPLGSAIDFERLPGQLAVINTLTCNAATSTGCATFATLPGPSGPDGVALFDAQTKTVYVLSFQDNFIAMFDGSTCNAISPSGCGQKFRALATGEIPNFFALNLSTHTFYATSQDTNSVWVIDQSKCNAKNTSGCTAFARATSAGDGTIYTAANANTKTVYVANFLDNTVSVIDSNVCNKGYTAGCNQSWPTIAVGNFPRFVAINKTTNTIYVSNAVDGTLSLINAATCTGTAHSGCVQLATTTVGNRPEQVAIDEATNTIYVGNIRAGTVSVINGAHCQSGDITHCGDSWPTVTVGNSPQGLGINPINHTVYVANTGDNTVSVINGNVCNGSNTSGCATATVATVPVGNAPRSIGVVTATNTLFVGNSDDLTVSVIDGSSCNGTTTFGCPQIPPPTVLVGAFPASASFGDNILGRSIAVDQKKQIVFIPVVGDDDIAELDGHACRAGHLDACHVKIVNQRMGGFAVTAAIDDSSGTVYVGNDNDSTVSLFGVHDQDED
jgi:DNA-binding beta-propeller fold protein YncE